VSPVGVSAGLVRPMSLRGCACCSRKGRPGCRVCYRQCALRAPADTATVSCVPGCCTLPKRPFRQEFKGSRVRSETPTLENIGQGRAHQSEEVLLRMSANLRGGAAADKGGDPIQILWPHDSKRFQKFLMLLICPIPAKQKQVLTLINLF
jgi:hypothetical protein